MTPTLPRDNVLICTAVPTRWQPGLADYREKRDGGEGRELEMRYKEGVRGGKNGVQWNDICRGAQERAENGREWVGS